MKPYNSEIIKAMVEHSDECAAYASAMKWDFWRRQKVEDVPIYEIESYTSCGFCTRLRGERQRPEKEECLSKCPLALIGQFCGDFQQQGNYYRKVLTAIHNKNQQAFTEAANNLYYQIRSIIDDFYKPEPKKEVFYRIGQKFHHKKYGKYTLSVVPLAGGDVFFTKSDGSWIAPIMKWNGLYKEIPKSVLSQHPKFDAFTLIEDKK